MNYDKIVVLTVILYFRINFVKTETNFQLIQQFLESKSLPIVTILACKLSNEPKKSYVNYIKSSKIPTQVFYVEDFCEPQSKLNTILDYRLNFASHGIYLDAFCKCGQEILTLISKFGYFHNIFKWLIIDDHTSTTDPNESIITKSLAKLNVTLNADITLAVFDRPNITYKLFDIYNHGSVQGGNLTINYFATWCQGEFLEYLRPSKYFQRIDLKRIELKTATVSKYQTKNQSLTNFLNYDRSDGDAMAKFSYIMVRHVSEIHNFSLQLVNADRWFGNDGGEPKGVQKLLIDKQIDCSAITGLLKPDRVEMLDWGVPIYPFKTCFVFQNPEMTSISNIFLSPFTYDSWYGLLTVFILFILIFSISYDTDRQMPISGIADAFTAAIVITLGVLCQQGAWLEPHRNSGKFLLFSLLVSSVLVYNFYTSSVVSSLLSAKPKTLKTLKELGHSSLQLGFEDQPYTRTIFQVTKNPDIQYLYSGKVAKMKMNPYMAVSEGIALIKKGGWAYHSEGTSMFALIARSFDQDQICKLSEINLFTPTYLSFMYPRFSPLTEYFKISQQRVINTGLYKRDLKPYYNQKPECFSSTLLVKVNLGPISPAFFLLLFGMISSLIIFLFEMRYTILNKIKYHRKTN